MEKSKRDKGVKVKSLNSLSAQETDRQFIFRLQAPPVGAHRQRVLFVLGEFNSRALNEKEKWPNVIVFDYFFREQTARHSRFAWVNGFSLSPKFPPLTFSKFSSAKRRQLD